MRFKLDFVYERSKNRPSGYLEDVLSHGKIIGDEIEFEDGAYAELLKKYRGAGDVVAAVAKPIARGIDALLGTDLANCGGCKERQDRWNEKFPLTK